MSAKELLRSRDLNQSLPKVIEWVGQATGVDRVHLFEIDSTAPPDQGRIHTHYKWCARGVPTPPEWNDAKGGTLVEVGLGSWVPLLAQGETIVGHVRNFEDPVRRFFEMGGLKSTVAVPIFVEGCWWGFIGFDSCQQECEWPKSDLDTLGTLAELVGAAVGRLHKIERLADANRIIENSPTILYRVGAEKPYPLTYVSQNVSRYGYDASDLLAKPDQWLQIIESADRRTVMENINATVEGQTDHLQMDLRVKRPDASQVWFHSEGYALRDKAGRLLGIEGVMTDVSERKRSEAELSFSHLLLSTSLESSPDAILIVDANARIIMVNRRFGELWGIPPELLHAGRDEPVLKIVASRMKDESAFVARVRYLYNHPDIQSYEQLELKDGRVVERHSGCLFDRGTYLGRVWFFRDITERERASEKIEALARTDILTGLSNRAAFIENLTLEFARAKRGGNDFAVLYLDLDHFKDVNDTLGHPVGDTLLRAVADRIKRCVRETDLVARLGGDEFAVLQDALGNLDSAEALAGKICDAVGAPFVVDGNVIHITASVGIAPYRGDIPDADVMMSKADLALYRAKDEGRNQYRFHEAELDREVWERVATGRDLRLALEHDEFELYYQPQVELASGHIVGLEALIRWNHPSRGLILPDDFISIAETTGSIVSIGRWVIDQVCRQVRGWLDQGLVVPTVALNLSAAQFKLATDLGRTMADATSHEGIAPDQLEVELTETVLMETTQKYNESLAQLRKIGVRLAIDDFGTGYSSLDYLRSFHVSRLKIDQRFIADVTTCADDAAIVRAIIGLASELGIEVVAEGLETAAQRAFLTSAGCSLAQGNFFSPPVTAAAATELLRRNPLLPAGAGLS